VASIHRQSVADLSMHTCTVALQTLNIRFSLHAATAKHLCRQLKQRNTGLECNDLLTCIQEINQTGHTPSQAIFPISPFLFLLCSLQVSFLLFQNACKCIHSLLKLPSVKCRHHNASITCTHTSNRRSCTELAKMLNSVHVFQTSVGCRL